MIEPGYIERKNALNGMVMNMRYQSKDPVKKMKLLIKKYGALADIYHCAAYEAGANCCIAVHECLADELAAKSNGWKTLAQIRSESYIKLKDEMSEVV